MAIMWILTFCSLAGITYGQAIVTPPKDSARLVGETAEFICVVEFGPIPTISWEFDKTTIYTFESDEEIYSASEDKYFVTHDGGRFTLLVKDLEIKDGGKYTCSAMVPSASAVLLVLDKPQLLTSTLNPIEGNTAEYICSARFAGVNIEETLPDQIPQLEMLFVGVPLKGTVYHEICTGMTNCYNLKQIYNTTLKASMNGKDLVCGIGTTNPSLHVNISDILTVHYSVRDVSYTPNNTHYKVGTEINCTADGNPKPHFKWEETETGNSISGQVLCVTDKMLRQDSWKCIATNVIDGKSYQDSVLAVFKTVFPKSKESGTDARNTSWKIGVGVIVAVFALAIGIVVFIYVTRRRLCLPGSKAGSHISTVDNDSKQQMLKNPQLDETNSNPQITDSLISKPNLNKESTVKNELDKTLDPRRMQPKCNESNDDYSTTARDATCDNQDQEPQKSPSFEEDLKKYTLSKDSNTQNNTDADWREGMDDSGKKTEPQSLHPPIKADDKSTKGNALHQMNSQDSFPNSKSTHEYDSDNLGKSQDPPEDRFTSNTSKTQYSQWKPKNEQNKEKDNATDLHQKHAQIFNSSQSVFPPERNKSPDEQDTKSKRFDPLAASGKFPVVGSTSGAEQIVNEEAVAKWSIETSKTNNKTKTVNDNEIIKPSSYQASYVKDSSNKSAVVKQNTDIGGGNKQLSGAQQTQDRNRAVCQQQQGDAFSNTDASVTNSSNSDFKGIVSRHKKIYETPASKDTNWNDRSSRSQASSTEDSSTKNIAVVNPETVAEQSIETSKTKSSVTGSQPLVVSRNEVGHSQHSRSPSVSKIRESFEGPTSDCNAKKQTSSCHTSQAQDISNSTTQPRNTNFASSQNSRIGRESKHETDHLNQQLQNTLNKDNEQPCKSEGGVKPKDKKPSDQEPAGRGQEDILNKKYFHGILPKGLHDLLLKEEGQYLIMETGQPEYTLALYGMKRIQYIPIKYVQGKWILKGREYEDIETLISTLSNELLPGMSCKLKQPVYKEQWELNADFFAHNPPHISFGKVSIAISKTERVAVKSCTANPSEYEKEAFANDVRFLKDYQHDNIAKFIGIIAETPLVTVMEYDCEGGLLDFLKTNKKKLKGKQLIRICEDVSDGMVFLSQKGCIHRDLAAHNCLIGKGNTVKICNFFMARKVKLGEEYQGDESEPLQARWAAPEVLQHRKYMIQSDIWSFGVLMWEIYSYGETPYKEIADNDILYWIKRGKKLTIPDDQKPDQVYQIMAGCWVVEKNGRPKMETLRHKLQNISKKQNQ